MSISRPYKIDYAFATCRAGMVPNAYGGCTAAGASGNRLKTSYNAPAPKKATPAPKSDGGLKLPSLDDIINKGKQVLGVGGSSGGGSGKGGNPISNTVDDSLKKVDSRIDRIEGLANKGIGESDQWQSIIGDLQGTIEKNLPIVLLAGGAVVLFFVLR